MFIIEGADHLGKTTAAKRMVELMKWSVEAFPETHGSLKLDPRPLRYVHMTRPNMAFDFFLDYKDMISKHAVQDRFHLGGLVWHENVINDNSLRLIESWLAAVGSFTVIFTVNDSNFYRQYLESHDDKQEMFSVNEIITANLEFRNIVIGAHPLKPRYDAVWTMTESNMFPDDEVLIGWLNAWNERLQIVERILAC